MVFVKDKKYACETCIKGHRSSTCKHTNRPLFEIKKKGRPVTQCEHCRELRKTKQVHVKCNCELREEGETGLPNQGVLKVSIGATFPSGLPAALEASAALQLPSSDGSDSDHSRGSPCKDAESCKCWTPRVSKTARGKQIARSRRSSASGGEIPSMAADNQMSQPAALVVNAHGKGRPVLPKPPSERSSSQGQQLQGHNPSGADTSSVKTHDHMYSPYGRAYEYQHGGEAMLDMTAQTSFPQPLPASNNPPQQLYLDETQSVDTDYSWLAEYAPPPPTEELASISFCGCGSSCNCAGCAQHQGNDTNGAGTCHDPSSCMACLDCMSIPIAPEIRFESIPMSSDDTVEAVDNWLREVSSSTQSASVPTYPNSYSPIPLQSQENMQFDSVLYSLWASSEGGQDSQPSTARLQSPTSITPSQDTQVLCGGHCMCTTGMCTCGTDCCGSCQGCACVGCAHEDPSRLVTFAVSGERGFCCAERNSRPQINHTPSYSSLPNPSVVSGNGGTEGGELFSSAAAYQPFQRRLNVSRASSFSSHSSGHHSYTASSRASDPEVLSGPGDVPQDVHSSCSDLRTRKFN